MALTGYEQQVQRLLNDLSPGGVEYTLADLQTYINIARAQTAADTESIRQPAVITTVAGQRAYSWAAAVFVGQSGLTVPQGLGGVLTAKNMGVLYGAQGATRMYQRSWPYFNYYFVQKPVPKMGVPNRWAEFEPGLNGTFFVDPIPDQSLYTIQIDAVALPTVLTQDSQPEPIPYPWTDAVPYFAAFLAYQSAQRPQDADRMLGFYNLFAKRGTQTTTSSQLPHLYPGGRGAREASQHLPITSESR